jgi:hypothetical protein
MVLRRLLTPSLADVFFVALLLGAFLRPGGLQPLLADGDTGWHVRTGQAILESGSAPRVDTYSFSRPGQAWCDWEWLADVVFARAWQWRGMGGVATLAGIALCLAAVALLLWLLRRGAGLWIAAAVTLAVFSASSIHYLARPHVFSILLYTLCLWALDEDRRRSGGWICLLAPAAALWANLHGGFVALPGTLALAAAVSALERRWRQARRYGVLASLCLAATCLNPYGWRLHLHIVQYLRSAWILDHVQEFQSPSIRSEGMVIFAVLLVAGIAAASRRLAAGERFEGALALVWGFAALRSARHIPFFAIAAAPAVACECALWWRGIAEGAPLRSARRVFWDLGRELGQAPRASAWLAFSAALALATAGMAGDFPEVRFPVLAVDRNQGLLAPPGPEPRILTSDQWADYLIFRFYPRQRVFFDGRSDFYGQALGADYMSLAGAQNQCVELMDRYRFDMALLPRDWPLSAVLDGDAGWKRAYRDTVATLYVREGKVRP